MKRATPIKTERATGPVGVRGQGKTRDRWLLDNIVIRRAHDRMTEEKIAIRLIPLVSAAPAKQNVCPAAIRSGDRPDKFRGQSFEFIRSIIFYRESFLREGHFSRPAEGDVLSKRAARARCPLSLLFFHGFTLFSPIVSTSTDFSTERFDTTADGRVFHSRDAAR